MWQKVIWHYIAIASCRKQTNAICTQIELVDTKFSLQKHSAVKLTSKSGNCESCIGDRSKSSAGNQCDGEQTVWLRQAVVNRRYDNSLVIDVRRVIEVARYWSDIVCCDAAVQFLLLPAVLTCAHATRIDIWITMIKENHESRYN